MTKKIQYCTCKINLSGQNYHTVIFDRFNPVTWPEVQVLQQLHGEENVMDVMPIGIGDVWPADEKNRLLSIYGRAVVESCFPGRAFRMEYMMTEDTDLPRYADGQLAGPNDPPDEEDDGEDEVAKAAAMEPIFKPSPRGRRAPPLPEIAKEA